MAKITIFSFLCLLNLLFRCGDIKANPGAKYSSFIFCHWNLNELTVHDSMVPLLLAYITQHNYDLICLSEKFVNFPIQTIDDQICIDEHILIGPDHPND